ncbi:peptide deformylase [Mycoplasmopsis bovirhinis]|uniref:peptide deformylase n=1 Tax=Mycoplasmopsis bovirhinis TaxID=29553 RepID=UPI000BB9C4CB|nr:peptide deformylase [Mycoplasmopsis bovirhinis]BBA22228.1 peptide deformylase [Mycoplasmopsis bovirhinis]
MTKKEKYNIKIVELPDTVLRNKSKNVKLPLSGEDIVLAKRMIYHIDTSQSQENTEFRPGVGVAAVQYGILKNVFYVYLTDAAGNIIFKDVLFNPSIVSSSKSLVALREGEGCLSVPEEHPKQEGYVHRSKRIIVDAFSYMENKFMRYEVTDYLAIVFQHELDHLNGKLFIDRINQKTPWKQLPKVKYL